ncbi:MAG: hypothetical protein P1Q69_16860, partial [Candidatus Thorarchaeota archaeon]|nr:hypothetical protein [Candidatus Thorarchaeota archaeon]
GGPLVFDFGSDDALRFVVEQPVTTKNELLNESMNQSGVTPADILMSMQSQVLLVRLEATNNPLYHDLPR